MNRTAVCALSLSLLMLFGELLALPCATLAASADDELSPFESFLQKQARWIITRAESEVFEGLATDEAKQRFIEAFWLARDPTPGTRKNEFRREHMERVRYAERQLGRDTSKPGYLTDRGRIHILLGKPQERKFFYSSAYNTYPMELWWYQAPKDLGLPSFFWVLFFKRRGTGEHKLYSPLTDGPESLVGGAPLRSVERQRSVDALVNVHPELGHASLSLIPSEPVNIYRDEGNSLATVASELLIGRLNDLPNLTFNPTYLHEFGETRVHSQVSYAPFDVTVTAHESIDVQGVTWAHAAIEVSPDQLTLVRYDDALSAGFKLLAVVEAASGQTLARFEEPIEIEMGTERLKRIRTSPLSIATLAPVIPGRHQLRVILQNETTGQLGLGQAALDIKEPVAGQITLTGPLLAYAMTPAPEQTGRRRTPFSFAGYRFAPATAGRFARGERALVYYQLVADADTPRLTKTVSIQRAGQEVQGQLGFVTPSREADGRARAHIIEELNIRELDPGSYEVVVSIVDASDQPLAERRVPLSITLESVPRPWYMAHKGFHQEPLGQLARQHLAAGAPGAARPLLERSLQLHPENAEIRIELARLLVQAERYEEAEKQLEAGPHTPSGWIALSLRAACAMELERPAEAVAHYRAALEQRGQPDHHLLNALGAALSRTGARSEARQAFASSLELEADQPAVRTALEQLSQASH